MSKVSLMIGGIFAAIILLVNSAFIVSQIDQVIVLQFGETREVVKDPGLHFKAPFIQDVVYFDNRLLEFNVDPREVILSDQKRIVVDSYVRFRIHDPLKFYTTVRTERNMHSRLNSIVESSLRQVLGTVPLEVVISEKRDDMMKTITTIVNSMTSGEPIPEDIQEELGEGEALELEELPVALDGGFGVTVEDVRIMRADLPQENSQAVFRRMQTEREQEAKGIRAEGSEHAQEIRAKAQKERTVILANAQRQSQIVRGEGDGKATEIYNAAFNRDGDFFAFWRSLTAYKKTMKASDTSLVLSPESEFLKYID